MRLGNPARRTGCGCHFIPTALLRSLSEDESLPAQSRQALGDSAAQESAWRGLRHAHGEATQAALLARSIAPARLARVLATTPAITVYDCKNTQSLPGSPVVDPSSSSDENAQRVFATTHAVADFYRECFGRNSVDDSGMTLMSSIHYGIRYDNAFWNGAQMTYGDGDGQVFTDFTRSDDVIGHELTHGVTQYTAGLDYSDQPGALNESVSDVFGALFHQWRRKQSAGQADWLIGSDVLGPAATAKGYTCLRSLAAPGSRQCLSPQPSHMREYIDGGDPHENSGIPNHAFYLAATSIGGQAWEKIGRVWYAALTSRKTKPSTNFGKFAALTRAAARSLFPHDDSPFDAVNAAWTRVGIPDADSPV